jgi:hypothetical protein
MKTNIPALAFLAAILPSCALAQQRAAELPALSSVVEALGSRPEAVAHGKDTASGAAKAACAALPATVSVGRGVFENDYTLKSGGAALGEVQKTDGGYVIKDNAGAVIAFASITQTKDGQTAAVTGCGGAPLGSIEELTGGGSSAFNIKAADGTPLMTTGWVDGGDMAASAPKASLKVEKNGLFDHFTTTINGAAPELGIFTTVMNNAAAYKRSAERRRENMGPHGRADR